MPLNRLDDAQEEGEIRKRKIIRKVEVVSMSSPLESCPSLGTGNPPINLRLDISPTELMSAGRGNAGTRMQGRRRTRSRD